VSQGVKKAAQTISKNGFTGAPMKDKAEYTDWPSYVFDQSRFVKEIETINGTSGLKCRFFRGRENLLIKMWKPENEFKEQDRENIRQEIRAICSNWLKMQNVCVKFPWSIPLRAHLSARIKKEDRLFMKSKVRMAGQ